MSIDKTPPRLSIEISEQQFRDLQRLLPHGYKTPLFRVIIDDLITLLEGEDPKLVVGAFIRNRVIYDITLDRRKDELGDEQ